MDSYHLNVIIIDLEVVCWLENEMELEQNILQEQESDNNINRNVIKD